MSRTDSRLEKGKYAYGSHSVFISGEIIDVFTGVWQQIGEGRALVKCEEGEEVEGGELMCVIKLRRPMTVDEYREAHHPQVRPLVKSLDSKVIAALLPAEMVCTIPDFMEAE